MMSPRLIVLGRKLVLPSYPPRLYVYAVKGGTTNSIDNMTIFPVLYLRPNKKGDEYFVNNIHIMQICSVCRVIGIKKKLIPMDDNVVKSIIKQVTGEMYGVEFANINMEITANDH